MLELLKKLVSIDSSTDESQIINFIEKYLKDIYGDKLFYKRQFVFEWGRDNLIVGNCDTPDVVLAWHVDTVTITNSFQLKPEEKDWKMYGRWTCDMKWWVAIMIDMIPELFNSNKNFWLLFYCDEENNFTWMKVFCDEFAWKIKPKLSIVPEPTDEEIFLSFRWVGEITISIKWKAAHSSKKHEWINAIEEFVDFTRKLEKFVQTKDNFSLTSSVNIGWIEWWIMTEEWLKWRWNVVSDYCKWILTVRVGNDMTKEECEEFIKNYFKAKNIEILDFDFNLWFWAFVQSPELDDEYSSFAKVANGNLFWYSDVQILEEKIWWDCMLLGPKYFNKAHQDDEFVEINSLYKSKELMLDIIKNI